MTLFFFALAFVLTYVLLSSSFLLLFFFLGQREAPTRDAFRCVWNVGIAICQESEREIESYREFVLCFLSLFFFLIVKRSSTRVSQKLSAPLFRLFATPSDFACFKV